MGLRKSFLACTALIVLGTSCSDNTAPQVSYGLIRVSVRTSGGDLDDGYDVLVGPERRAVTPNGSLTMTVTPGQSTVQLAGVASNCVVEGPSSVSVDVPRGNTADVSFSVTCSVTGFQLSIHTTGDDTPGSYSLEMTRGGTFPVPVNANLLLSRLQPGTYTLRLHSPISSCSPTSVGEVSVELPPRTVVPVTFEVACTPVVRLEKIAYMIDSTESPYIALSRPEGNQESVIVAGTSPSWSPDGKEFAYSFTTCADDYYGYCTTYVGAIDPETLKSRILAVGSMPAWSPQNDAVAFIRSDNALSLVLVSGGVFGVTIPDSLQAADPAWSPDGTVIAFRCNSPHGFSRLCTVNRNGTGFQQLTDASTEPALHPAWSHDGSTIAFTSVGINGTSIATMPSSGGEITKLAEGFDPAWSRDGTKLIFARADGLFTMNPDGSNVQRLTTGRDHAPAWRP